ncbi:MAG: class I SAM-dependent methyltransferase [Actinomycetes bacterium]
MTHAPGTWHYGLVADWWAQFNTSGPEIDYFGRFVRVGQPALDAGCGTGRLLIPWLRAGYDVDGCDVSADMLERCREQAEREGLRTTLFEQALHDLAPPRRYRTIVACGVFGLGSTRAHDVKALARLHDALEPGGVLLLDQEVPYGPGQRWEIWTEDGRARLPEPWPREGARRASDDGSEYELRTRAVAFDPLDQLLTLEIHVDRRVGGQVTATEDRTISIRMYFRNELLGLLADAGFADVDVRGDYTDAPASPDSEYLVFVARKTK